MSLMGRNPWSVKYLTVVGAVALITRALQALGAL